jgi:hypothetical protein
VLCVISGAHEVERYIRLVADDPAIMTGRNVKDIPCLQLYDCTVFHRGGRVAGDDDADVLDIAIRLSARRTNVSRPFPTGLVRRASDRQAL